MSLRSKTKTKKNHTYLDFTDLEFVQFRLVTWSTFGKSANLFKASFFGGGFIYLFIYFIF